MSQVLMPKATAVWLVENTSLSFDQIAELCHLHPLEVKAIADGDAAQGIAMTTLPISDLLAELEILASQPPDFSAQLDPFLAWDRHQGD